MNLRVARDAALVVAGALLARAAVPPTNVWALGLAAWVPLAAIATLKDRRSAFALGWLQGALVQAVVVSCLPSVLRATGGTSVTASYLLAAVLMIVEGARYGLIAFVTASARQNAWPTVLVFPCAVVCAERFWPMVFPWTTALFVNDVPVLLQSAELGGPWVISLWIAAMDAFVVRALARREARARFRDGVLVPVAILGAAVLFGAMRLRTVKDAMKAAPALHLGVVPGDSPRTTDGPARDYVGASHSLLARQSIDVLVWPELALDQPVGVNELTHSLRDIVRAMRTSNASARPSLVAGAALKRPPTRSAAHIRRIGDERSASEEPLSNAAVSVDSDGIVSGVYAKRTLVPFGEMVPLDRFVPGLRALVPKAGTFTAGSTDERLVVDGHTVLPRICLEDMLPEEVRAAVATVHPELIVGLTSDTWFRGTIVPELHLGIARLRAVEHRLYLLHVSRDGVTALVAPTGEIVAALRPGESPAATMTAAWLNPGRTSYESIGDALCWLATAILALCTCVRGRDIAKFAPQRRWRAAHG